MLDGKLIDARTYDVLRVFMTSPLYTTAVNLEIEGKILQFVGKGKPAWCWSQQRIEGRYLLQSLYRVSNRFSGPYYDFHLDPRAEPVDDRHEAVNGEPPEVCVADAREVGPRDAGAGMRGAHGQAFPVDRLDDFGG